MALALSARDLVCRDGVVHCGALIHSFQDLENIESHHPSCSTTFPASPTSSRVCMDVQAEKEQSTTSTYWV